ncbi:MAG: cation:proton antiporter [Candidatus Sericytochromatia bacterium]|nr:cation:proton antiporter [Candidatus Tanganyikabacteria bacterium]
MIALLAGGGAGADSLVRDIGLSVFLAGLLSVLFTRFKIPSIAAFLAAGILAGPEVSRPMTDRGNIETIAHLGLVLLLFLIGLEIDVKKILASGRTMVLTGLLQFPLCVAFGFAAAWLIGRTGWGAVAGPIQPSGYRIIAAADRATGGSTTVQPSQLDRLQTSQRPTRGLRPRRDPGLSPHESPA